MAAGAQVSSVQPETTTEHSPRSSLERELSPLGETEAQNGKLACLLKITQLINARWDHLGPSSFSLGMAIQLAIMVTCLKQQQQPANSYHATGTLQVWGHICAQNKNSLLLHRSGKSLHKAIYCFKPGYLQRRRRKKKPARYQKNIEDRFQAEKWG